MISYLKPYNYANKWLLLNENNYLEALDRNTWDYTIKFKLFFFRLEYFICNCKLLVLRIVAWSYYCLPRIIMSYLKPYQCKRIPIIK